MVIAQINKIFFLSDPLFILLLPFNTLSKNLSDKSTNKPPIIKPKVGNNHTMYPKDSDKSRAGAINDQKDAAIIIPAEKPSTVSRTFLLIDLKKKTVKAPRDVTNQVNKHAIKACMTGLILPNQFTYFTPYFIV